MSTALAFKFFNFVMSQPADLKIKHKNSEGELSWKECALGRFIQEVLVIKYEEERNTPFSDAKYALGHSFKELNSEQNLFSDLASYSAPSEFPTYGDLQEYIKNSYKVIPEIMLDFYEFVFDKHPDTKINHHNAYDQATWDTCAVGRFVKAFSDKYTLNDVTSALPHEIYMVISIGDKAPKRYGKLQKLITEVTGYTK